MVVAAVLIGLAAWRLAVAVTLDKISEGARMRVQNRWPPTVDRAKLRGVTTVAGVTWVPVRLSEQRKVREHGPGYLIACPFCASVWTAAVCGVVWVWAPAVVTVVAAAGVAYIVELAAHRWRPDGK